MEKLKNNDDAYSKNNENSSISQSEKLLITQSTEVNTESQKKKKGKKHKKKMGCSNSSFEINKSKDNIQEEIRDDDIIELMKKRLEENKDKEIANHDLINYSSYQI